MGALAALLLFGTLSHAKDIVHDAEYYILEAQHGEKWATEDKELDKKLAEFKKKNGGKPPNIFYILIDDIGFGDLGRPSKSFFQRRQHARNRSW